MSRAGSLIRLPEGTDPGLEKLLDGLAERLEAGEAIDPDQLAVEHPEYAEQLRRIVPGMQALVDLQHSTGDGSVSFPARNVGDGGVEGTLGDFRIVREVGRGGMGVVYEAEQISLQRRVALKVLPFAATMDPRHLTRFQTEARAAAMLHHPNVVPVYGVGSERGVHYYAMQFIDGEGLDRVISRLRAGEVEPPRVAEEVDPSRTAAYEWEAPQAQVETPAPGPETPASSGLTGKGAEYARRIAELGAQAADALEYAHSMGVVHRDVKPGNLLLDDRGQVWVADFGLAKLEAEAGVTVSGDMLGTLRYMSPEQALARHGLVDHRSDVYSLGATLYELLTLRPAIQGTDRREILRQIAESEPTPPRKLDRSIPADLETVVLKAMEKEPHRRYATAGDMAEDLRRFLANEPVRAKRASLGQRGLKWARRNRVIVAAASLVLVVVLVAAGVLWVKARERAARSEELLAAVLAEAERLAKADMWPESSAAVKRASLMAREGEGSPGQRATLEELRKDVGMVERLRDIRLKAAELRSRRTSDNPYIDDRWAVAGYSEAFRDYGIDVESLSVDEAAARINQRPIRSELAFALDCWAGNREIIQKRGVAQAGATWQDLVALASGTDTDAWRGRLRELWHQNRTPDPDDLTALMDDFNAEDLPPHSIVMFAELLRSWDELDKAIEVLRAGQVNSPGDFWINSELADRLMLHPKTPNYPEAVRFYTAALVARPNTPHVESNLCGALIRQGRFPEALALSARTIRSRPDFAPSHHARGLGFHNTGQLAEAERCYREAIRLDPGLAQSHNNLANILNATGRVEESIASYRQAVRHKSDYLTAHHQLGQKLLKVDRLDEAIDAYRSLLEVFPEDDTALSQLGAAYYQNGELADALSAFRAAYELLPNDIQHQSNLAIILWETGGFAESLVHYRELARVAPERGPYLNDLALRLANCPDPAIRDVDEAIQFAEQTIEMTPDQSDSWTTLGIVRYRADGDQGAIEALKRSIELSNGGTSDAFFFLAMAHYRLGEKAAARGWYDKAVAWMDEHKPEDDELKRFRAEAAGVLGVAGPAEASADGG